MSKIKIIGIEEHTYAPELTRVLYNNDASIALNELLKDNIDLNHTIKMLYHEGCKVDEVIKFIKLCLRRHLNTGKYATIYRVNKKYKTNTLVLQGCYTTVLTLKRIIDDDFLKHGLLSSEYKIVITFKSSIK